MLEIYSVRADRAHLAGSRLDKALAAQQAFALPKSAIGTPWLNHDGTRNNVNGSE